MQKSQASAAMLLVLVVSLMAGGTTSNGLAAEAQEEKGRPRQAAVTVERYQIDVSFQPEKGFLRAQAVVTLRASEEVRDIEFELNPHLKILEVTDAKGRKLDFARSGRLGSPKLSVRLAEPATGNITLTFTYEGALPQKSLDYITNNGILLRDEARWYPAVDLAAFTENDITISVPVSWYPLSSGYVVEQRQTETAAVYRWRTEGAVSSRSIAALPGSQADCIRFQGKAVSGTPVENHEIVVCPAPQGTELNKPVAFAQTIGSLVQRYSENLGAYGHRGLTVVRGFPGQRGAIGYSAPGFLVVSEDVVKFFDYPGYAPEFLPHEIAHQWFPIEVTLAREADGWLAESLAEYLAWRYLAEKDPDQARRLVARAMRDALAAEPLRPLSLGLKLFALENWYVTHQTLYQRGLLVWRTLETVIDRERVDRALREYYRRYRGRAGSIADFRKICEEISGRDLGWFFDYHIHGKRIPEIELRRTPASVPSEVTGEIVLKNTPAEFQVRVEMRLETTSGVLNHSVATRGETTPFTVTSKDPITRITLDPDLRILRWTEAARRNRSQRALLGQIGELETKGEFARAADACQQALALDPENLAANEQQIRFALGRLRYRMKQYTRAFEEFRRVLALGSLDPMASDFNRAWSRLYRARIEARRGRLAAARAEARAGLAMNAPALQTQVILPEAPERTTTAAAELRRLSR